MLDKSLLHAGIKVLKKLQDNRYEALFAGGYVRDMIWDYPLQDIDIATSAPAEKIEQFFSTTKPIGKSFGVILVQIDGYKFEVTTFRKDGKYLDGRRPEKVIYSSRIEDAKRRDLTINGLYFDALSNNIYDDIDGLKDLKTKTARFIGSAEERIQEDKLRMLRIVRFVGKYNLSWSSGTLKTIQKNAEKINIISAERIWQELLKIIKNGNYKKSFDLLFETKIINHILPEIVRIKKTFFQQTLLRLKLLPDSASDELRWAALLQDLDNDISKVILKRLKCPNKFISKVCFLIKNQNKIINAPNMKVAELKRFMHIENLNDHLMLYKASCLASNQSLDILNFLIQKKQEFKNKLNPKPFITGEDLLKLGMKPSAKLKEILEDTYNQQLEGKLITKEEALNVVVKT